MLCNKQFVGVRGGRLARGFRRLLNALETCHPSRQRAALLPLHAWVLYVPPRPDTQLDFFFVSSVKQGNKGSKQPAKPRGLLGVVRGAGAGLGACMSLLAAERALKCFSPEVFQARSSLGPLPPSKGAAEYRARRARFCPGKGMKRAGLYLWLGHGSAWSKRKRMGGYIHARLGVRVTGACTLFVPGTCRLWGDPPGRAGCGSSPSAVWGEQE